MKKIFFLLLSGITIVSCTEADNKSEDNTNNAAATNSSVTVSQVGESSHASQPGTTTVATPQANKENLAKIEWLDGTNKDFGKITEGKKLDVVFRFKNTGEIKAAFDSNGKPGAQSKNVNVFANTDPQMTTLVFRVEVKAKS
jgi:hypothetical protein